MPLESNEAIRITKEVTLGMPAPNQEDQEHRAFREQVTREVEAIRKAGGVVELPSEIPEMDA